MNIFSNGKAARQIFACVPLAGTTCAAFRERTIHAAACWLIVEGEADALYLTRGVDGASTMWRTTSGVTTIADKKATHAALAQAAAARLQREADEDRLDAASL